MYFDTHAHYDSGSFNGDRMELLASMPQSGVELIINPGCDLISSKKAISLAESFDFVYAAVGWHPEDIEKLAPEAYAELTELAKHPKCLAIGEIGLDYYWDASRKDEQKELFCKQAELAIDLKIPVIIHDREAHGDCMEIVRRYPELKGVFHCFSGSVEMARELLNRGFYLGFDGPITYKNARKAIEVLEFCPMDRILIETDSPYLSPVPNRGKRNDSRSLVYVVEKIAEIKGISPIEAAKCSSENGRRLFGL